MTDTAELIARLWAVVILDEDRSDNPLGREAADALSSLVRERDEARAAHDADAKAFLAANARATAAEADRDSWRRVSERLEGEKTAAEADAARMREALVDISSPAHTLNLLWWQIRAREALASLSNTSEGGKGE